MLISKKFIVYTYFRSQTFNLRIISKLFYLLYIGFVLSENILKINYYLLKNWHNQITTVNYAQTYILKFNLNTKYLFLFTLYIIYSKLHSFVNSFFFQFNIMTTKHKKYTILRAPCNHKNSKEQFGFTTYKAKLIKNCSFRQNKFYNEFIVLSFFTQNMIGLTELNLKYQRTNAS